MSMSVVVWAACRVLMPDDLPEPEAWRNYGHPDWAYETKSWQVLVEPAVDLGVPTEVKSLSSGASEAVIAVVEPAGADQEAYRFLNKVAVAIAVKCGGAVVRGPMGLVRLDAKGEEIRD